MPKKTLTESVQAELGRLTNTHPDDWFLVFRARHGMEVVLKTLADVRGSGEVLTQAFTCATALNPILSAGHIPVYVDTGYEDFSVDTTKLQASAESRALIMQHTFGVASDMKTARTFANKHSLLLLEDSAHQLGQLVRNTAGTALADISVHSFGVEKMLPTKFGGAIWVNPDMKDHELRDAIRTALNRLPVIDRRTRGKARRYKFFNRLLNHTPAFAANAARSLYIWLGLFEPAIMPEELRGRNHGNPARPDKRIMRAMLEGLKNYEIVVAHRRAATEVYLQNPPANLKRQANLPEGYAPARFALLCENGLEANRLFRVLRENGHYSGKWYQPVIFPGTITPELYNYDPELCPIAENISARILNLPTNISPEEAKEILDVLHRETD